MNLSVRKQCGLEMLRFLLSPDTRKPKFATHGATTTRKNDEGEERVFTVLEIPPVNSPQTAVRASIDSDAQKEPWRGLFFANQFRDPLVERNGE